MVETWCHGCVLSLGHYNSHERDWGAYTQEVAKFSMKDVVLLVIHYMVGLEVLETPLIGLCERMNEFSSR